MQLPLRRLAVPVFVLTLVGAGLAYAATEAPAPAEVVETPADDTPSSTVEEPDEETTPVETPEGEVDAPEADDAADEAEEPSAEHGTPRSTDGCDGEFSGNHGAFVSASERHPRTDAAHSNCGKPQTALDHAQSDGAHPGDDDTDVSEDAEGDDEGDDEADDSDHRETEAPEDGGTASDD